MSAHARPQPIRGPLLDGTVEVLLLLFCGAAAVIGYRLYAGIGPVSNMSDGFTWGIWEPVNVVVFFPVVVVDARGQSQAGDRGLRVVEHAPR